MIAGGLDSDSSINRNKLSVTRFSHFSGTLTIQTRLVPNLVGHAQKDFNRVVENNDTLKVGDGDSVSLYAGVDLPLDRFDGSL